MTRLGTLLRALCEGQVEFLLIGGAAATAHGATRLTQDLDILYRRGPENMARLAEALAPYSPYPRGAPEGLPFQWSARTLELGLNFTLTTTAGWIDLLGEVTGGAYETLAASAERLPMFGVECLCVSLEDLIRLKRSAGRPKDFEAIAELVAILEELHAREE